MSNKPKVIRQWEAIHECKKYEIVQLENGKFDFVIW